MLLSEILGEGVLLLSLVALCTAGPSRILNNLVKNADDTLRDSNPERDDFLLPNNAKSTTTKSPKSPGQRANYIYSHYHIPNPNAYGSFASPPSLYTPTPYNYGLYAMTTHYPYHPMAGYYPYSAMNSLNGYNPMAASYFNPAINSPYGYQPMAGSYFNPAINSPYGYQPMAGYYPYSAMNSLYGYPPMAASYLSPAMNSFYPMVAPYSFPAMNPLYVPVNGSFPKLPFTAYTFHAPMSPFSYLQPPMGYSPLYPPVGGSYYPMNSFYPYSAAMMPFNSFHPPMYPLSYLQPPMGYPLVSPAMNTMNPYTLMNPLNNPVHPMHPANLYNPMNPLNNPAHPMHLANPYNPMNPLNNPAHPMHSANLYNPMNPLSNPAHPMHSANLYSPLNPVTNPTHPMNPYNPMNPINSLYNGRYFHPPMQVASHFLTPPLGTSYPLSSNGYGHFHPVPMQAASNLLQPSLVAGSPLNLHMHFPYSYQAGMYSPYFLPPYQPSAALQAMYPPYGYAAGVPGAMAWSQFGGAAWNPYFPMGYGASPLWPSQFAHMWPMHPYYQTVVPAQEGLCSFERPFQCWGSFTCVPIDAICDKTFDCNNHADEDPRICIAGRRPAYGILVSYLALPDQQWMVQKLFNNVDPYTTGYALKLATSLGDLRWSLALTDENINNTKTVLEAVKNDNQEPLIALGMPASSWESVKFLMNSLLSTDFFLA